MPPARPDRIVAIASACSRVARSSMNTTTLPPPSWIAFGYMNAITYRTPASDTSPNFPSRTSPPIIASQLPLSGKPVNWQLHPGEQLQASMLWTLTRQGVRGCVADPGIDGAVAWLIGNLGIFLAGKARGSVHPVRTQYDGRFRGPEA